MHNKEAAKEEKYCKLPSYTSDVDNFKRKKIRKKLWPSECKWIQFIPKNKKQIIIKVPFLPLKAHLLSALIGKDPTKKNHNVSKYTQTINIYIIKKHMYINSVIMKTDRTYCSLYKMHHNLYKWGIYSRVAIIIEETEEKNIENYSAYIYMCTYSGEKGNYK